MVLTILTALHMDHKKWATPDTLNAEHFLENGEFKKKESVLPFSMGEWEWRGKKPESFLIPSFYFSLETSTAI